MEALMLGDGTIFFPLNMTTLGEHIHQNLLLI
jgi:hypothetical protein